MNELQIDESEWTPNDALDDPRSRMLALIYINGCPMHLEAWAVIDGENGQEAALSEDADDYESLYLAVHADGGFQTVEIAGREYILVATPHC